MSEYAPMACDPQLATELLRAIAHPMRLAVLCRLMQGESSVGGFEAELGLRQPSLSQQLALLREAGLVTTRREAKSIVYGLADNRIALLIDALHQYFTTEALTPASTSAVKSVTASIGPGAPRSLFQQAVRPPVSATEPASSRSLATAGCGVFAEIGWNQPGAGLRNNRHE